MTNQVQVSWMLSVGNEPPPKTRRTAITDYFGLVRDVENATNNLAAIPRGIDAQLRIAYPAALEATAILDDPEGERREMVRAMRRLRQHGTEPIKAMAKQLLDTQQR